MSKLFNVVSREAPLVRFICGVNVIALMLVVGLLLKGSALNSAPTKGRQWVITATTVAQAVVITDTGDSNGSATQSIRFVHDTAGGANIFVGFNGAVAAAPTNGSSIYTFKAASDQGVDIRATSISVACASGTADLRIQAVY